MKHPVKRKICAFCSALFLFVGCFFVSCSDTENSVSFMKSLETADVFIKNGEMSDALRILKHAEKNAFSSFARIGIYRRYAAMGEDRRAEKVLSKGLQKLPENEELSAVYGQFLLRRNRIDEALTVTKILEGTKYGSIHSEAALKKIISVDTVSESVDEEKFFSRELSSIYYDMYVGTNDVRWLRNCAIIFLLRGEYMLASSLQSEQFEDSEDALFWGLVQYDSGNYDRAVENCAQVRSELLRARAVTLASDAYMMLGDEEHADFVRDAYISDTTRSVRIPPILLVNSSLFAYRNGNYKKSYELLLEAISENEDFVPALVSYGKLAGEDSETALMSDLEMSLRKTKLRTTAMREYDERPKFTVSDALFRLDEAEKRARQNGLSPSDELIVERLLLFFRENKNLPQKSLVAALWRELEKNEMGTNLYPAGLVQFSVHTLLSFGLIDDARTLFKNYIDARLDYNHLPSGKTEPKIKTDVFGGEKMQKSLPVPDAVARLAFGDRAAAHADSLGVWEIECAAYFSLLDGNSSAARRLYEYVVFETAGVKNANKNLDFVSISSQASLSSAANLATIYFSTGEPQKALELYALASGKAKSKRVKSFLLYRAAYIQAEIGNEYEAKLSLEYCLSLDPDNADARLLKKQIEGL